MTYTPIADGSFTPPLAGSTAYYTTLITNDAACWEEYTPGFLVAPSAALTAAAREFRWRVYGNMDGIRLFVGVRAYTSGGPFNVTVATPGVDSDVFAVTDNGGSPAWYQTTLDAAGPLQEVIVSSPSVGGTLSYSALQSRPLTGGAPVAGTLYGSGFRLIGGIWDNSGYPIPSEIVSRLRTNPMRIARDRPVCVAAHVSDTVKAVTAKSPDVWGAYNSTAWSRVGRLTLPRCADRARLYRVDAYANETTPGTGEFSVKIGGANEERWSGVGWHSWQVLLGPGPHEVWPSVLPGTGNGAAIRTLTIWRTEL